MDREAEARAIVLAARQGRKRPPRWLWGAALVTAVVCVGALAIAWLRDGDTVADKPLERHAAIHSSGFGIGILIGVGLGIAIGSVVAVRSRRDG